MPYILKIIATATLGQLSANRAGARRRRRRRRRRRHHATLAFHHAAQ